MRKATIVIAAVFLSNCSFIYRVKFNVKINGYNPGNTYQMKYMADREAGDKTGNAMACSNNGICVDSARFINVYPRCVDLLENGIEVDRFCVAHTSRVGLIYENISNKEIVTVKYRDQEISFNFNTAHHDLISEKILFDSISISARNLDRDKIELVIHDASKSADSLWVFMGSSFWKKTGIKATDSVIVINKKGIKKQLFDPNLLVAVVKSYFGAVRSFEVRLQ